MKCPTTYMVSLLAPETGFIFLFILFNSFHCSLYNMFDDNCVLHSSMLNIKTCELVYTSQAGLNCTVQVLPAKHSKLTFPVTKNNTEQKYF